MQLCWVAYDSQLYPTLCACRVVFPSVQAMFCHVPVNQVLTMHDVSNIWRVPLMMQAQVGDG